MRSCAKWVAAALVVAMAPPALAAPAPPALPAVTQPAVKVAVDAGAPAAALNQALVGVDGPGPAGATTAMAELGMRWVRTDVSFESSYNCSTGAWSSQGLDNRVEQIRSEGARPLLIVDYSPPCLATGAVPGDNSSYYPPDLGASQARWDRLVYTMAVHEITTMGVRSFEIWNEPDGTFWRGSLPGYLHLYQDTATVLEQAAAAMHARIEVGGPALVFADSAWIEPFLAWVVAQHLPLDFLSWHYYGNYPGLGPIAPIPAPPAGTPPFWYNPGLRAQYYGVQVTQVRAEVSKYPSLHPLLWLDEWNADAGYDARMNGPYDAAFAAAVLDSLQQAGLDRSCVFDVANDAGNYLADWGLLTAPDAKPALQPKPVWYTFLFWHELGRRALPVSLSPPQDLSDPAGRVGAVAAEGPGGELTVLVYDFVPYDPTGDNGVADPTPYDHQVVLSLGGLRAGEAYRWTRSLVDGAHPAAATVAGGRVSGPSASIGLDLAGEGVTLITARPAR